MLTLCYFLLIICMGQTVLGAAEMVSASVQPQTLAELLGRSQLWEGEELKAILEKLHIPPQILEEEYPGVKKLNIHDLLMLAPCAPLVEAAPEVPEMRESYQQPYQPISRGTVYQNVWELLDLKADPNCAFGNTSGNTALINAVLRGNNDKDKTAIVWLIFNSQANKPEEQELAVTKTNKQGFTALHYARCQKGGDRGIVTLLERRLPASAQPPEKSAWPCCSLS